MPLFNSNHFFKGLTLASFGLGVLSYTNQGKVDAITQENIRLLSQLEKAKDQIFKDVEKNTEISGAASEVQSNLANYNSKITTIKSNETVSDSTLHDITEAGNKVFNSVSDLLDKINKGGGNSNGFSATDFLVELQNYFASLSFIEYTAILNLLGCFIILFCLSTIIISLLSEFLLIKFNIATKYPRLNKFLLIRKKLQTYYLVLDFAIIIVVLFSLMYVNFIALT